MQLALSNAQTGLKPLEIGLHALRYVPAEQGKAGGGLAAYAARMGKTGEYVGQLRRAAEVFAELPNSGLEVRPLADKPKVLYEISKAPRDNWAELCSAAASNSWTVERTRQAVNAIHDEARAQAEAEARIAEQEEARSGHPSHPDRSRLTRPGQRPHAGWPGRRHRSRGRR